MALLRKALIQCKKEDMTQGAVIGVTEDVYKRQAQEY